MLAAVAAVAAVAAPAIADKKKASEHVALAESAERRKDWRRAIDEYELAYAAAAHPAMLYNIARNYERLSEPRSAAVAPVKMMVPAPTSTMRRAAARPTLNPPRQPLRQVLSNTSGVSSRTVPR